MHFNPTFPLCGGIPVYIYIFTVVLSIPVYRTHGCSNPSLSVPDFLMIFNYITRL